MPIALNLNSISRDILVIRSDASKRDDIIKAGQALFYDHARRGKDAMMGGVKLSSAMAELTPMEYKELNTKFQHEHLLYCAKKTCELSDTTAPESFEDFKRRGLEFYANSTFLKVLQGIYQEIITPILPAVYSEAVSRFADVVEVGFMETYAVSVGSNDIPVFQDSAWGASRSVPANRLYSKDYTLNPQPKTAQITMKWMQMIGNGMDYGQYFANLVAGMYAKTMGMWNAMMTAAASNTALIPTGLTANFSSVNWVTLANKLMAVNNVDLNNLIAYGNLVALSKVLPTQATGSTNVNMDAALATLLGREYIQDAQLGEYMGVRLMPLRDAVIPGTQNTGVTTVLDATKIWMMASNRRKPLVIAYNSATPITIEIDPLNNPAFEYGINMTISLDSAAIFSSKVGLINI